MTDRNNDSVTGSTPGGAEGASVASPPAAPMSTTRVQSSRARAATPVSVEDLHTSMLRAFATADEWAKVASQRRAASDDESEPLIPLLNELTREVDKPRTDSSRARVRELIETIRQRRTRAEEESLLAEEASRLQAEAAQVATHLSNKWAEQAERQAAELAARRSAEAEMNDAAWQAYVERHPDAAFPALLRSLPVDAWRATPKTPMPQVTVTVTPLPVRMEWVTCGKASADSESPQSLETTAVAAVRGVPGVQRSGANLIVDPVATAEPSQDAVVVAAPSNTVVTQTTACAEATSHGMTMSDTRRDSPPCTGPPSSELRAALARERSERLQRLQEDMKMLDREMAAMKLAEEAGEAEQAEYDRQVAAQMEWQRQEDAAVMAASEKKRDALNRERARLQQERASATLTARAHGHFKGGRLAGSCREQSRVMGRHYPGGPGK